MFHHEKVHCESCEGHMDVDDALYDEQAEVYFCDHGCFND